MRLILSFIILICCNTAYAGPDITICISDCSKHQAIQISDSAWLKINEIFNGNISKDKEERSRISEAVKCIEIDIIEQFTKIIEQRREQGETTLLGLTGIEFTNKDETFNTRKTIELLLDNNFIKRHFLRNSQTRTAWLVQDETAVAIQSKKTGEIYIIDSTSTPFGEDPMISPYKIWKNEKSLRHLPKKIASILNNLTTIENRQDESK